MTEKDKAIAETLKNLNKKYGSGSVFKMDDTIDFKVEVIPTGCFQIDQALGCGGLPRGRIIELYGEPSEGKSTLSMFFMAQVQKQGGIAVLVDAENSFTSDYAKSIGVDTNQLYVNQPTTLEEAMDVVAGFIENNADLIVVDSVAALVPKKELEGEEMLADSVAVQARLMNKALRILTGSVSRSKTTLIFINQVRDKIGVMYGAKTSTPGGKALKFYSSVRLEVKKGEKIERDGKQIGNWLKINVVKNKVGTPYQKAEFELVWASGVDLVGSALDFAVEKGIIAREGNSYKFGELKLGVGRDNAKASLNKDEKIYQEVLKVIGEGLTMNKKVSKEK